MLVLPVRNVHEGLQVQVGKLAAQGIKANHRIVFPTPVTTVYVQPTERVPFWETYEENPFILFMEAMGFLSGGSTAGNRIGEQARKVVDLLRWNPDSGGGVVTLWDARSDLGSEDPRVPDITQIYAYVSHGSVDLMVTSRSLDVGMTDMVSVSMLHEYMARMLGLPIGALYHVTSKCYARLDDATESPMDTPDKSQCPYTTESVEPFPLMSIQPGRWYRELTMFKVAAENGRYDDPFFDSVASPIYRAWNAFSGGGPNRYNIAKQEISACGASDWKLACWKWLERRENANELS